MHELMSPNGSRPGVGIHVDLAIAPSMLSRESADLFTKAGSGRTARNFESTFAFCPFGPFGCGTARKVHESEARRH